MSSSTTIGIRTRRYEAGSKDKNLKAMTNTYRGSLQQQQASVAEQCYSKLAASQS